MSGPTTRRSIAFSTRMRIAAPLAATLAVLGATRSAGAQEATPIASRSGILDELLAVVPASVSPLDEPILATVADFAEQLARVGAERPDSIDDDARMDAWIDAILPFAIAEPFRSGLFTLRRDLLGFDLTDVDVLLECGTPPAAVLVLRGRFDRVNLEAAWSAGGYVPVDVDGTTVASLGSEAEVDTSTELGRIAHALLNNACLLADGTLVYTATLDLMRAVLATVHDGEGSLARRADVRTLLDAQVDRLVTGFLFSGLAIAGPVVTPALGEPGGADAVATQIAELGEMPPIALGLVGMTAGGPLTRNITGNATPDPDLPIARVIYSVLMAQPGTAMRAAEIAEQRLATMESVYYRKPYRELFAAWETTALADGDVLRLEFTLPPGTQPGVWMRHLVARDVLFLAW